MPMDRFYIGPYDKNSGLRTDVKPFVIPEEAFSKLQNAYVFRGRVRKRFGSRWLSNTQIGTRLRVALTGTTDPVTGNYTGNVPINTVSAAPIVMPAIGQMFSIGAEVYTVVALGTPANLLISGATTTATFNTTTGAVVFTGATVNSTVYYYPSLPVMGLLSAEATTRNVEPTYAFDTSFAYTYNNITGGWERLAGEATANAAYWLGNNSQFFWGANWTGADPSIQIFFVTNYNIGESVVNHVYNMRYLSATSQWTNFTPLIFIAAGPTNNFMFQAQILVPFKNRLLAFNTYEGATVGAALLYQNRCRYSWIGDATDVTNGWRQDVPGSGNAIDAPTTQAIVTVEFIKDRLIVFFERSTYELVYTGNQAYPFQWQLINTELGAESTFSIVPFDKVAIGIGNVGIHACNGSNVERIDSSIPDQVFSINNIANGNFRVYGVRDYFVEMIYWTYPGPAQSTTFPFPSQVLVYNYKTGTWAINDDAITCFGYFQPQTGILWSSQTVTWSDNIIWGGGPAIALFSNVIAGNQQGYTFIIDADTPINSPNIQITQIAVAADVVTITSINHNLQMGQFIFIQDVVDTTGNLTLLNGSIFKVINTSVNPITATTFSFVYPDTSIILAGVYQGNGTLSTVSLIDIFTKEYNFYANLGRNAAIQKVDFLVDRTNSGEVTVDFYASSSFVPIIQDSGTALLGTGILQTSPYPTVPTEQLSVRLWHSVYFQAEGEYIQFQITMSDDEMTDPDISQSDFQLHAILITTTPTSQRLS
jgi:hypothetical protein